jgi:serine/threonine protein kinase
LHSWMISRRESLCCFCRRMNPRWRTTELEGAVGHAIRMSYNRRGPTVESERWRRIQALYQAALAQDAHKRAGYLEEACARDETLRAKVEVLLQHAEPPSTFVDLPVSQLSPHTVDGPPVLIGTQLGCYQVIGLLGSGGMGHVFKARDPRLGRFVAIKILSDRFSARFEREARAVAALNHPNVCTLYDIGPNYLVMEFVEGMSLAAHLRDGPLEEDMVLRYGIQVAEALAAAHAQGIVHRDLKPENVLITTDDRVKLMDFGLALMLSPSAPSDRTVTTYEAPVTQPGTVLGTFPYMSPEQARGENAEPTSDIFSLGSVLYEAISGRRAFARPSAAETMAAILKDEPAPFDGQLELDRIIRRCLAKDAKQRFQTAREVGAALAHARTGAKPHVGSPPIDFDSLAVLPFVNMAGDEDTEYLCEGIAETLINHLSQVPTLRRRPHDRLQIQRRTGRAEGGARTQSERPPQRQSGQARRHAQRSGRADRPGHGHSALGAEISSQAH